MRAGRTALALVQHGGLFGWAALARLGLRLLPLSKTVACAASLAPLLRVPGLGAGTSALSDDDLRRVIDLAVRATGRGGPCLPRALVSCLFLASRGGHPVLTLGVRRAEAGIEGHAWVESAGGIVWEDAEEARTYTA